MGSVVVSFIVENIDLDKNYTTGKNLCCNFFLGCRLIRDLVETLKHQLPCENIRYILLCLAKREVLF